MFSTQPLSAKQGSLSIQIHSLEPLYYTVNNFIMERESLYEELRERLMPRFEWLANLANDSVGTDSGSGKRYFRTLEDVLYRLEHHELGWKEMQTRLDEKEKSLEKRKEDLNNERKLLDLEKKNIDYEKQQVDVERKALIKEGSKLHEDRKRLANIDEEIEILEEREKSLGESVKIAKEEFATHKRQEWAKIDEDRKVLEKQQASLEGVSGLTEKVTQMLEALELRLPIESKISSMSTKGKHPELAAAGAASGVASDVASVATSVTTQDRPLKRKQEMQGEQGSSRSRKVSLGFSPAMNYLLQPSPPKSEWQLACEDLMTHLQAFRPIMDISCSHIPVKHVLEQLADACLDDDSVVHLDQFLEVGSREKWYCFHNLQKRGHWQVLSQISNDGTCPSHKDVCLQVKRPEIPSPVSNLVCRYK